MPEFEDVYGVSCAAEFTNDEPSPYYTDEYNAFLKNGCVGTMTRDQAIAAARRYSGRPPETVTEFPEIDAVTQMREEFVAEHAELQGEQGERLLGTLFPYEPLVKVAY